MISKASTLECLREFKGEGLRRAEYLPALYSPSSHLPVYVNNSLFDLFSPIREIDGIARLLFGDPVSNPTLMPATSPFFTIFRSPTLTAPNSLSKETCLAVMDILKTVFIGFACCSTFLDSFRYQSLGSSFFSS